MNVETEGGQVRDPSWSARLEGLIPRVISEKRVAVIGCGSVGSFIADELARAGVSKFILIDPDVVEWPNLTRAVYGFSDIGNYKVDALSKQLKSIFPDISVLSHSRELQDLSGNLVELLNSVDLVIAAVDDPRANGMLDRYCYATGTPIIFVGIYKGAKGGEVITVDPARTPCFGCATGGMRESLANVADQTKVVRDRDYGTNKLVAEVALGTDIHFVCNAAVKIALSLLVGKGSEVSLGDFMNNQLDEGVHYLMLGMEPNYYIFPATHEHAIGQHAFQSLWLKTTRRDECPRCGKEEFRDSL